MTDDPEFPQKQTELEATLGFPLKWETLRR